MKRLLLARLLVVSARSSATSTASTTVATTETAAPSTQAPDSSTTVIAQDTSGQPADIPTGPLDPEVSADLDLLFGGLSAGMDLEAVGRIGASGDVRLAWLISDLFRFLGPGVGRDSLLSAFSELTGEDVNASSPWVESTDLLIGWDLPEPPRYRELKGLLFTSVDSRWAPFFDDPDSEID